MADFSFLSDTDESAVEDLISQAKELCILEQVAAINCSGFTDSSLPSELETRFRKLKSFPAAKSKPKRVSSSSPPPSSSHLKPRFDSKKQPKKSAGERDSDDGSETETETFSPSKQNPLEKTTPTPRKRTGSASSPSNFSTDSAKLSPLKKTPNGEKRAKNGLAQKHNPKSKSRSVSSSSSESSNLWDSPSPPKSTGCFWCSPSKKNKKRGLNRKLGGADLDWCSNDEFLSDLGVFSAKERNKILRKSMKEEEKISREADKIVKWAKQASARMSASAIADHELSDDDESTK